MPTEFFEPDPNTDPITLAQAWLGEAALSEPQDPDAAALATVDAQGMPNVRMVLVKHINADGFCFFTNSESAKGIELAHTPKAALCFHWKSLQRQMRVRGDVLPLDDAAADAYFNSRHPQSRRGAHASAQSRPLPSRADLLAAAAHMEQVYPDDDAIPRPSYWRGYSVTPRMIEFWQQGAHRLHDRFAFTRANTGEAWQRQRLYP